MFRNILIGVDGRSGGRDAVALAQQLAAPDAVLTFVHGHSEVVIVGPAVLGWDEAERRTESANDPAAASAAVSTGAPA